MFYPGFLHETPSSHTELVTAPTEEPVSLDDAKLHLRVDFPEDDALISSLVSAARQLCETKLRRAFVTQTWDLFLDGFPGSAQLWYLLRNLQRGMAPLTGREYVIELPRPPLQSVISVTYFDQLGAPQTLGPSQYRASTGTPGRVTPAYGLCWPVALCQTDAVVFRYAAGYGPASAVPAGLKAAVKILVGHWYANREAVSVGTGVSVAELPVAVRALLSSEDWGSYS